MKVSCVSGLLSLELEVKSNELHFSAFLQSCFTMFIMISSSSRSRRCSVCLSFFFFLLSGFGRFTGEIDNRENMCKIEIQIFRNSFTVVVSFVGLKAECTASRD